MVNADTRSREENDSEDTGAEGADSGLSAADDAPAHMVAADRFVRLAAEFDNFRKRTARAREEARADGRLDVLSDLLPLYDNFVRALDAAESNPAVQPFLDGIELIRTQFDAFFAEHGMERIAAIAGSEFDPNMQQAAGMLPAPSEALQGKVAQELQAGFTVRGRLVRPATVLVYA
jgi:molecular chaperone GrpE